MINTDNHKRWTYIGTAGVAGIVATSTVGIISGNEEGRAVHSPYLFDDSSMFIFLLWGVLFTTFTSLYHTNVKEQAPTESARQNQKITFTLSVLGALSLITASLYSFNTAFLGDAIYDTHRPNAGPDTTFEKAIFSVIYSLTALAGLFVAYAEKKSMSHYLNPPGYAPNITYTNNHNSSNSSVNNQLGASLNNTNKNLKLPHRTR